MQFVVTGPIWSQISTITDEEKHEKAYISDQKTSRDVLVALNVLWNSKSGWYPQLGRFWARQEQSLYYFMAKSLTGIGNREMLVG
jgi:hypothetical protein